MKRLFVLLTALVALGQSNLGTAQQPDEAEHKPATIEHYYKVKWGHFDEFYDLFRKNHYPILKRLQETGHILEMHAAFPVMHASESNRWDMRFTIVYANPKYIYEYVYGPDLMEELFPDQELFMKEEQKRFSLLLEHVDIPIRIDDLSDW